MPKYPICLSLFYCEQLPRYYSPTPKAKGKRSWSGAGEHHLPVPDEMLVATIFVCNNTKPVEAAGKGYGGAFLSTAVTFRGFCVPTEAAKHPAPLAAAPDGFAC